MDLNEMLVFTRVVQAASFTTAAAQLGMPKSTVSRKVTELEERLGARLLNRTTRKLSLTDAGRIYFDYGARIVSEVEDAERAVSSLQAAPRGLLRVTTPINMTFLAPIITDYAVRFPEVHLELLATTRRVDLIEERFDVGIRAGTLLDSSLIARNLGIATWFLVATPGYLKKRGRPRSPEDLQRHACLQFAPASGPLRLERGDEHTQVSVTPRILANDSDILYAATTAGVGIALLPAFRCMDDLRTRRLERVLPDWSSPSTPVQAVYPSARHISPKVKSFADHLQARMSPPPWELGPKP
jgi:DNA-binding transcriptional LysR family regulator